MLARLLRIVAGGRFLGRLVCSCVLIDIRFIVTLIVLPAFGHRGRQGVGESPAAWDVNLVGALRALQCLLFNRTDFVPACGSAQAPAKAMRTRANELPLALSRRRLTMRRVESAVLLLILFASLRLLILAHALVNLLRDYPRDLAERLEVVGVDDDFVGNVDVLRIVEELEDERRLLIRVDVDFVGVLWCHLFLVWLGVSWAGLFRRRGCVRSERVHYVVAQGVLGG